MLSMMNILPRPTPLILDVRQNGSLPVRPDRIVQTFTWEGMPDGVALETVTFEDLGDGRTRLHATSLCESFEDRDAWLRSGMEIGVNDGYAALDRMLADGTIQ